MNINNLVRQLTALVVLILPLLSLLLGSTNALGGELPLSDPYIPRPYGVYGLSINGGGYQAISENMGGGLRVDSPRILSYLVRATWNLTPRNEKGSPPCTARYILFTAQTCCFGERANCRAVTHERNVPGERYSSANHPCGACRAYSRESSQCDVCHRQSQLMC